MKKIMSVEEVLETLPTYFLEEETYIIDIDGLCPCGKGINFKKCCLNKVKNLEEKYYSSTSNRNSDEINIKIKNYLTSKKFKDIPSFKLYKKSLSKKNVAFCLASNSKVACSGEIRFAHTLAESSALKVLSEDEKNLYTFNRFLSFPSSNIDDYFVPIRTREASIVNTFCEKHDKSLFKELENGNEYKSEPLQNYQLALNAAALNSYGLILQILLIQKLINELEEFWLDPVLHNDYAFYIEELKRNLKISNNLIYSIENNDTSGLLTFSINLENIKLPFSFCEGSLIKLMGKSILTFINVFPSESGTWITVSTYQEGKAIINCLNNKKNDGKINEILKFILEQIAEQGSNIYFQKKYIKKINEKEKAILSYFFTSNGATKIADDIKSKYFIDYSDQHLKDLYFETIVDKK